LNRIQCTSDIPEEMSEPGGERESMSSPPPPPLPPDLPPSPSAKSSRQSLAPPVYVEMSEHKASASDIDPVAARASQAPRQSGFKPLISAPSSGAVSDLRAPSSPASHRKISNSFSADVQESLIPPEARTDRKDDSEDDDDESEGFELSAEKKVNSMKMLHRSMSRKDNNVSMRLSFVPGKDGNVPVPNPDVDEEEEEFVAYRPIFTYCMIAILILVFILTMWYANWQFESININPLYGPSIAVLTQMGAKVTSNIVNQGEWWRLITAMFLHAGLVHLALNVIMFARIGVMIEEAFGFWRTGSIYLISGFSGSLTSSAMNPTSVGVGASGALYGLVGALLADFIQNHKLITEGKWMYLLSMILSLIVGLGIGMLPILDNW
jgi:membrane associated rhomboid family serine protease